MGRYTGPKVKKSKRVRAPISDTAKHHKADLDRGPGVHGMSRRRKLTIYGERLREKQKLAFFYHVSAKQFRRYMDEAKRGRTNTGDKVNELLERRLDNVVRRAGFCRTIWQARQVVVHGHVTVNGKKVDRPSFQVSPGDEIGVRGKSSQALQSMADSVDAGNIVPGWITVEGLKCKIERLPEPDKIFRPFETNMLAVVEFM
ncbi:MAG: 30S ribosomal protein S4 [Planctomycetota bacterium]|nr:30S ribosomal protein S4 [Planctomycetota bacterium]